MVFVEEKIGPIQFARQKGKHNKPSVQRIYISTDNKYSPISDATSIPKITFVLAKIKLDIVEIYMDTSSSKKRRTSTEFMSPRFRCTARGVRGRKFFYVTENLARSRQPAIYFRAYYRLRSWNNLLREKEKFSATIRAAHRRS